MATPAEVSELRNWLQRHKMTHSELAKQLGVARITVTRWANERQPVPAWLHFALRGIAGELWEREHDAEVARWAKERERVLEEVEREGRERRQREQQEPQQKAEDEGARD